jgi:1-acyl-sn-glycerol-3-phosphate acyltransferase
MHAGALAAHEQWFSPRRVARTLVPPGLLRRIDALRHDDRGHGYDRFGMHRDWVALAAALTRSLYEHWFRVTAIGVEHIPRSGPAILAANHSGTLPFDAMMIWADVLRHTDPPRAPRAVLDHFVTKLPFFSTVFTRAGAVGGSRGNLHALLDDGELILLFPEGVPGIGKDFRERYRLQLWRVGHAELAIHHGAPIVPVAVVGAEEQMPQIARLKTPLFGAPYLPIALTPFPLPVHYRIYYGEPIPVAERYHPGESDVPAAVEELAQEVCDRVRALLELGLASRGEAIFR